MKKVLIVDDDPFWHRIYILYLKNKVEIISAYSVEEATEKFRENPDISAVVMDACVPGSQVNTEPLVREMRKTFKGPMLATSSESENCHRLFFAGCDDTCEKGKEVPEHVLEALNLT